MSDAGQECRPQRQSFHVVAEPVPEAPMGLKPNIQSFGQHSLVAPGQSAHVAATSSQAAALQQVHPASSQGAHPAQPLAEAQPASHRDATSHPVPAQQVPPSDVPGIALQDRHKVIRSAEVAPPQPTVARSDVSERSQSQEPMNAQGQVKSTRWLAPTTSKGDDRNSRGERLCETETSVTLCGVKYQKIELIGKGGSCRVRFYCSEVVIPDRHSGRLLPACSQSCLTLDAHRML